PVASQIAVSRNEIRGYRISVMVRHPSSKACDRRVRAWPRARHKIRDRPAHDGLTLELGFAPVEGNVFDRLARGGRIDQAIERFRALASNALEAPLRHSAIIFD